MNALAEKTGKLDSALGRRIALTQVGDRTVAAVFPGELLRHDLSGHSRSRCAARLVSTDRGKATLHD